MTTFIRKEEIHMKSFNRMTEKQMSKVDGGLIGLFLGLAFGVTAVCVGTGAGIASTK